jgi:hypothetical protein
MLSFRFKNLALALILAATVGFLMTSLSSAAYGQTIVSGDITGFVTDSTNAVIVGASVTLTSDADASHRTVNTGTDGSYRFSLLPPGTYSIKVAAPGLVGAASHVTISVGRASTVNITVKPASVATEIIVDSSSQPLLQTEDANITTSVDARSIEQLPVPGGDISTLAFTAPGVNLSTGAGYGGFVAFGLPATANLFTMNGNDIMDPYLNLNNSGASNLTLGANEVADVAIVNNGYTAQYGRYPGTQVNYTTKSGANAFHGDAQWYWNGRALNANDWINKNQGGDRPFANSNQWAGAVGGPIWRNKLFFYFDTEGMRYVLPGGGGTTYIPTTGFMNDVVANVTTVNPAEKGYYANMGTLYAGASGASHATTVSNPAYTPGATSDCGALDGYSPAAAAVINAAVPAAYAVAPQTLVNGKAYGYTYTGYSLTFDANNVPTITPTAATTGLACTRQFYAAVNNLNTEALWATRIDQNLGSQDHASYRIHHDWGVQATGTDAINSAFNANSVQPEWEGQFNETHTFSSFIANDLILSGLYYSALFGPPDFAASTKVFPTTVAFADGLGFANIGGTNNNYPQGRNVQQYQLVDDLSIQWKRHSLKFGINYRGNKISDYRSQVNKAGLTTINSLVDFAQGTTENGSTVGQSFATAAQVGVAAMTFGLYAQDEWATTEKLKMTLSLRMDHNANFKCLNNCFSRLATNFAELTHDSTIPYNKAINTGLSAAFPATDWAVVQPRVGFSYAPKGIGGRSVLRGGVGLFSDLPPGTIVDRFLTNAPNVVSFTYAYAGTGTPGLLDPTLTSGSAYNYLKSSATAFESGFSSGQTLAQIQSAVAAKGSSYAAPNYNSVVDTLHTPKYLEWNFEGQFQLSGSDVVDFNYVGNHAWNTLMLNTLENIHSSLGMAGLPAAAPDQRFAIVTDVNNNGKANYNGLTSSIRHTAKYGLTLTGNYTYSHALDLVSNGGLEQFSYQTTYTPVSQLVPSNMASINYGNADYDIRHSTSFQYIWAVPYKPANPMLRTAAAGWSVSGNLFYRGGYPMSIVNSHINSYQLGSQSTSTLLAALTSGSDMTCAKKPNAVDINTPVCFKGDTFAQPTKTSAYTYGFGNIARNSFRGPHYFNSDLQLNKETRIMEKATFKLGANFFNVLNHANFSAPANNAGTPGSLGAVTSTVTPPSSPYGSFEGSAVSGRVVQIVTSFTF